MCLVRLLQKMRVFQKNIDEASARLAAAESSKNNWTNPTDVSQVPELLDDLQVKKLNFPVFF